MATYDDFLKLDIRVGKIVSAEKLPNPKHTTHKLIIDFGESIGQKISGARVVRYSLDQLIGALVVCVINLPPKKIGAVTSEVLTLGVPGADQECVLVIPKNNDAVVGGRLY
jgi:tRNA-binding protein